MQYNINIHLLNITTIMPQIPTQIIKSSISKKTPNGKVILGTFTLYVSMIVLSISSLAGSEQLKSLPNDEFYNRSFKFIKN